MDPSSFLSQLEKLRVWKRGDERAPHERRQVDPSAARLLREGVGAGFIPAVQQLLESDPVLRRKAAALLLARCYPSTYHEDILATVGLEAETEWETVERRVRDPTFRQRVLVAWDHSCGICSFDVTLGAAPLALDAAHIRWKQYRGPDTEGNGIALCALHHRLFDRGAFTLVPATRRDSGRLPRVAVSERARGERGIQFALLDFHGPERPWDE